ncbi:MAG: suppressor of fused domain protein [Phycisphaerae bacterium]
MCRKVIPGLKSQAHMFDHMLSAFGLTKRTEYDDEAYVQKFAEAKDAAIREAIGPMHEMVLHAIIPYAVGGALDLYPFHYARGGTVYATQEVMDPNPANGPLRNKLGRYELVACLRKAFSYSEEDSGSTTHEAETDSARGPAREGDRLVSRVLNPIARYSAMAVLQPGETAEIPETEDAQPGDPDNLYVLFDEFELRGDFNVLGERCGLLLCMPIHKRECDFARQNSGKELIARLKTAGVYPYSDLTRRPVV